MTQATLPQLSTDFDTELEQVKRSRAQIDLLRKQIAAQGAPKGEMIGKRWTPPTMQEYLQPAIQQFAGYMGEKQANEREAVLNKAMQADREKWVGAMPRATAHEVQGPPEEGMGPPMSKPIEPSQQEKLAWAAQGERNPLTKALAQQYGTDVLIKEPEREEARAWRGQQAEETRTLAREKMTEQFKIDRDKLAEQIRDAKEKSRMAGLTLDERTEWHKATTALEKKLNDMKMSVEPPNRSKERTKLEEQVNSVHSIDSIVESARPLLKNATGSGFGAALDAAGSVIGVAIPGSKEAADLKVVEANLMKHQPKFKGTDSDRDTKLYQKAAADIGNASTPNSIRETAINTVQRLARKDMEMTHRLAENFNIGSGEHLPRIDIPDMPPPLPLEKGAPVVAPKVVNPNSALPRAVNAARQVSGAIGGLQPAPAVMPQPMPAPGGGIPPGVNVPTNVGKGPAVTAQLPPAEIERANILMSEYNKGPTPPPPGEDPSIQAGRDATDKASLKRELARIGVDADTGGPLQRRATDKAPAVKVRTWNREKGAFE